MAWEIRKHPQHHHDRISGLPDDVLGEILSSLPVQEVVATSILSKRWKRAWTFVGALDIRDFDFLRRHADTESMSACFLSFFKRVLTHVVALRKLELDCYHFYVEQHTDIVINKLVNAHVGSLQELDLTMSGPTCIFHPVKLPESIFTSRSLVVLKLSFLPSSSTVFRLPRLKVLHIRRRCMDLSCVESLLAGCPVLEEMFMEEVVQCRDKNVNKPQILRVKSSSLKRLILRLCAIVIQIDAPNLEYLQVHICKLSAVITTPLALLTRLRIDVSPTWNLELENHDVFGNALFEILAKAPNVKFLSLKHILSFGCFYQQRLPSPMLNSLLERVQT